MSALSNWFQRLSSGWALLVVTVVYAVFLSTVMPAQSAASRTYAGDWGAPDRQLFYTPDRLYAEVAHWGDAGRDDYVDFRLGLDIGWALTYGAFLVIATSLATRRAFPSGDARQHLNLLPLLPVACDLLENALGILLVSQYPSRLDPVAWMTSGVTAAKWLTLLGAHLALLYALIAAALSFRHGRN